MFQLDDDFLNSLGLGNLPDDDKEAFLSFVYAELELRVGRLLSKTLTDAQLDEFEALADDDKDKAADWLEAHCPDYRDVVSAEIDKIIVDIAEHRDDLLGLAA